MSHFTRAATDTHNLIVVTQHKIVSEICLTKKSSLVKQIKVTNLKKVFDIIVDDGHDNNTLTSPPTSNNNRNKCLYI